MGLNFPSRNRFVLLTFYLISLSVFVYSQPTYETTVTIESTDINDTEPLPNKTVLFVENMTHERNSHTNSGIISTDVILITGCVFSIVFLSVVVFAIYRYQLRKSAEYQRAAKVQVSSTRNAGVYMDLAIDKPDLPISVPMYNSMKKRLDQYTFISDDELDL